MKGTVSDVTMAEEHRRGSETSSGHAAPEEQVLFPVPDEGIEGGSEKKD